MDENDLDKAKEREEILVNRGLAQIKVAMKSAPEDGSVTECEDCGCEIPPARLRAAPWTRRCVDCQAQYEAENA